MHGTMAYISRISPVFSSCLQAVPACLFNFDVFS